MEYPNIIAAVPENEYFDASAINEGVYLSTAHLNSIETAMAAAATNVGAALNEVTEATERLNASNVAVEAANATIGERDATIAAQAAEIAALKAGPAALITNTSKDKDETASEVVVEDDITKEARRLRSIRDGK